VRYFWFIVPQNLKIKQEGIQTVMHAQPILMHFLIYAPEHHTAWIEQILHSVYTTENGQLAWRYEHEIVHDLETLANRLAIPSSPQAPIADQASQSHWDMLILIPDNQHVWQVMQTYLQQDEASLGLVIASSDVVALADVIQYSNLDHLPYPIDDAVVHHRLGMLAQQVVGRVAMQRYNSLMQNSGDAIVTVDMQNRITGWNRAAEELYGWSFDEIYQKDYREVVPTDLLQDNVDAINAQLASTQYWRGRFLQYDRDKNPHHIRSAVTLIHDQHGMPYEVMGINRDITSEYIIEQALRAYQERTQLITSAMNELVLILDSDGRYLDIVTPENPNLVAPADELLGNLVTDFFTDEQAAQILQRINEAIHTSQTQYWEYTAPVEQGEGWYRATITPFGEDQVLWVAMDVTDMHTTKTALDATAKRYQTLFHYANDAILVFDLEMGNILEANRQATQLTGYTTQELQSKTISDLEAHTNELPTSDHLSVQVQTNDRIILEQFYRHKDGTIIPVETSSRVVEQDGKQVIISFVRDIRERKQALRAEREQRILAETLRDTATAMTRTVDLETLLDLIVSHAHTLIGGKAVNVMLIEGNLAHIVRHRGYSAFIGEEKLTNLRFDIDRAISIRQAIKTKRVHSIPNTHTHPEWLQLKGLAWIKSQVSIPIIIQNEVVAIINADSDEVNTFGSQERDRLQALAEQAAIALHNVRLLERTRQHADELKDAVDMRTSALSEANQALKRQIQERKTIEEQLQQERNLLKTLIDSIPDLIYVRDTEGRYRVINDATREALGVEKFSAVVGKTVNISDFENPDWNSLFSVDSHLLETGEPRLNEHITVLDSNNAEKYYLVSKFPLRDTQEQIVGIVGVCTDISDLKAAENALQQANSDLERRVQQRTEELTRANSILTDEIIVRQRAEESERQQRILAEALRDSGAMLIDSLDNDRVLDYLLDTLVDVIPHDVSHIALLHDDKMFITKQRGYDPPLSPEPIDVSDWQDVQVLIDERRYYIIHDREAFSSWAGVAGDTHIRSNLSIPIIIEDEVVGVLKLESYQKNHFTDKQAEWLLAFANQAGIAMRNARLLEELEARVQERTAQLENERAQLRAIMDSMRDGVIYRNVEDKLQYTNSALTDITGYTVEEWRNGTALEQINESSPEEYAKTMATIERHLDQVGFWRGNTTIRHKNNSIVDVNLTRTVVHDSQNQRIGVVTVMRDISQEKALAEQKARFIASASHELRTPIANLKTRLFLMQRRPEKYDEHVEVANKVVNWMQHLVEDMFDLSRFERGVIELDFERVPLQKFINDIVIFQQPEAERKMIRLLTQMPAERVVVYLDAYRMTQVITNLVTNAIHYTPEQGEVRVDVDVDEDTLTICVVDDGEGIEPEHLQYLFQPFYRGNMGSKGAGLGLSIVREIVELHDGTIHVESEVGQGSRFIIHLPMRHEKSSESTAPNQEND
jgi:PAS domain S-box-containing protein